MPPRITSGYPPLYAVSALFFLLALAGIVILIGSDIYHHYDVSLLHQRLDADPLILIGLSCITMYLGSNCNRVDKLKGIFLGIAWLAGFPDWPDPFTYDHPENFTRAQ